MTLICPFFRCKVPECDLDVANNRDIQYDQPWLPYAIPLSDGKYDKCFRYAIKNHTSSTQCAADMFDNSTKIKCTEYVYASDEINVQTEVGQINSKTLNYNETTEKTFNSIFLLYFTHVSSTSIAMITINWP